MNETRNYRGWNIQIEEQSDGRWGYAISEFANMIVSVSAVGFGSEFEALGAAIVQADYQCSLIEGDEYEPETGLPEAGEVWRLKDGSRGWQPQRIVRVDGAYVYHVPTWFNKNRLPKATPMDDFIDEYEFTAATDAAYRNR